jgi:hypothetical protein
VSTESIIMTPGFVAPAKTSCRAQRSRTSTLDSSCEQIFVEPRQLGSILYVHSRVYRRDIANEHNAKCQCAVCATVAVLPVVASDGLIEDVLEPVDDGDPR